MCWWVIKRLSLLLNFVLLWLIFLMFLLAWECKPSKLHLVMKWITEYILMKHLSLLRENISYIVDQLDFSLVLGHEGSTLLLYNYIFFFIILYFWHKSYLLFLFSFIYILIFFRNEYNIRVKLIPSQIQHVIMDICSKLLTNYQSTCVSSMTFL